MQMNTCRVVTVAVVCLSAWSACPSCQQYTGAGGGGHVTAGPARRVRHTQRRRYRAASLLLVNAQSQKVGVALLVEVHRRRYALLSARHVLLDMTGGGTSYSCRGKEVPLSITEDNIKSGEQYGSRDLAFYLLSKKDCRRMSRVFPVATSAVYPITISQLPNRTPIEGQVFRKTTKGWRCFSIKARVVADRGVVCNHAKIRTGELLLVRRLSGPVFKGGDSGATFNVANGIGGLMVCRGDPRQRSSRYSFLIRPRYIARLLERL